MTRSAALLTAWACCLVFGGSAAATEDSTSPDTNTRRTIGLVLSGGGARGMAHIGTLKMIDSLGVHVDYVAGTSMGGLLGALYASGYSGKELERIALETEWTELFSDAAPRSSLPWNRRRDEFGYVMELEIDNWKPHMARGLIAGQRLASFFSEMTFDVADVHDFDDLPIPWRGVAIDLITGREVVLESGNLARAMRATMAMPTVFSPVIWGDSLLVDGGTKNNFPVDICREMGADVIIASDVTKLRRTEDLNSAVDVLGQWLTVAGETKRSANAQDADYLVVPAVMKYTMADFVPSRIADLIRLGEAAARLELAPLGAAARKQGRRDIVEAPRYRLRRLEASGNRSQPDKLIKGMLGLSAGDPLTGPDLRRRIERLHGLGYFAMIDYSLRPVSETEADLLLNIRDASPQQLLLGLSFNDLHKFVVNAGARATNRLLSGLLLEADLQCVGLFRVRGRASLPSRTLNLPLYPLVEIDSRSIPTEQYNAKGDVVARFDDQSTAVAAGLGLNCAGWLSVETTCRREQLNMDIDIGDREQLVSLTDEGRLGTIRTALTIDTLDDLMQPRSGILLRALYETSFAESATTESWRYFTGELDLFGTLGRRHTLRGHAFFGDSRNLPSYKYVGQARPDLFAGLGLDQLRGDRLSVLRLEYIFRHNSLVQFKVIGNIAPEFCFHLDTSEFVADSVWGCGLGVRILTPLGSAELIGSRGHLSFTDGEDLDLYHLNLLFGAGLF